VEKGDFGVLKVAGAAWRRPHRTCGSSSLRYSSTPSKTVGAGSLHSEEDILRARARERHSFSAPPGGSTRGTLPITCDFGENLKSLGSIIEDIIKLGKEAYSMKRLHWYDFEPVKKKHSLSVLLSDDF